MNNEHLTTLLMIILILSQVLQTIIIRKPPQNPKGNLTEQQHNWIKQIWEYLILGKHKQTKKHER